MPYSDDHRPYVPWWFSASDAENVEAFVELISVGNQSRLEAEGGVCIVATHLGKGFCVNGAVRDDVRQLLVRLAERRGWFVPVGPMLDELRARRTDGALPPGNGGACSGDGRVISCCGDSPRGVGRVSANVPRISVV